MKNLRSRLRGGFSFALILTAFLGQVTPSLAATLLPPGKQTFINANGAPLAQGTVTFYTPGTTTPKATWQDAAQTILNTNPVNLDISGQAIIYGSGCYRQIVKDSSGNTIWDQPTCDTSSTSLIWAGHSGGTANSQTITASNFTATDGQTISFIPGTTNTLALSLVVNGTSINVLKDLSTGSVSLAGGEVVSGNLAMVTYDATRGAFHLINNPVTGSNPVSILSASGTTDLGLAASQFVNITGSASITSFGSSASVSFPSYVLKFSGASTLVNSANLIIPGATSLTVGAGDYAQAVYLGSGNWQVYTGTGIVGAVATGIPGEIRGFAMASCPAGWLEGNGANVSATTYPRLFAALGTTWGTSAGNVSLPDTRGYFPRGWDHGTGVDAGRVFGTYEQDQLQDHTHNVTVINAAAGPSTGENAPLNFTTGTQIATSIPISGNHGTETRPKNFTVLYCIKY
jgi:microcystin-dependent protein